MAELLPPNSELVTTGWIKSLPGINPDLVATTIPEHSKEFAEHGFVQVTAAGGSPNEYTGMQGPLMQIDAWAYNEGSKRLPWGKANTLLSHIKAGIEGKQPRGRIVTPSSFDDAFLHSVVVNVDPQRVGGDPAYARYSMLIRLWWTRTAKEVVA